jgi:trimeric autotransporter adhesin
MIRYAQATPDSADTRRNTFYIQGFQLVRECSFRIPLRRIGTWLRLLCIIAWLSFAGIAAASEYHGRVIFQDAPVPGATVTATNGDKTFVVTADLQGVFSFPDLTDGAWTIDVEMQGFAEIKKEVQVAPNVEPTTWELKLLPLDVMKAQIESGHAAQATPAVTTVNAAGAPTTPQPAQQQSSTPPGATTSQEDVNELASSGFLINGSVNNGAASPFAQLAAFGNNRRAGSGLYNGGIGIIFDNSAFDARPFSLSGQNTPKASYNQITGVATLGGPLRIPHLLRRGPDFFVAYQWMRNRDQATQSALLPDSAERTGDFSHELNAQGQPVQIFDPTTGQQFQNNMIPHKRISPQAQALLNLYPPPNFSGDPQYNYQIPTLSNTHQDALLSRLDETINSRNQLYGGFAFLSTRTGTPNVFEFLDTTDVLGINANPTWSHRFGRDLFMSLGYRFSRLSTRVTPYWENRENISGDAGIMGNDQDPTNWGPPTLMFSSGLTELSEAQSSFNRNETNGASYSLFWYRGHHGITFGGDFRRQEFNYLSQQNPRGTFTFSGAATQGTENGAPVGGDDFADFLLGIPDTSSVAFGNADKYFRESVYDAYITDDWRIRPEFTVDAGIRWEYGAPITELFNRLVNLDVVPGFASVAPVVATNPLGPLTGERYPNSLIRPDKRGFEPRIGIAWRPVSGSSLVVRAGYGIYYDTSVYQTIALQMAQQEPLSKSLTVQNSAACPLTLANGFTPCSLTTADTFAADPSFRPGYAQTWNLSVQRDLPGSLQLTATYLGTKGTHGVQEFLPNTFPPGATNPCPTCPTGFAYLASNGNLTRQAAQVQLRRRLHNGLTANLQYTFAKSIDDDSAVGGQGAILPPQGSTPSNPFSFGQGTPTGTSQSGPTIAQNWLDLRAEKGLSTFDQHHLLNAQLQYTTGMGVRGGTLLSGWKGRLFKEWTFLTQITAGSGLPETPIYGLVPVPGTGVTGTIRPDETGAPVRAAPAGLFLNPVAYTAPTPGQWGNAGRDSIIGPSEFSLDASMVRTFRLERFFLDVGVNSTNPLNHVTFTTWDAVVNSAQFGLPVAANPMRSIQTTLRLRF